MGTDDRLRKASRNVAASSGDAIVILDGLRELLRSGQELGDDAFAIVRESLAELAGRDRNILHGRAGRAAAEETTELSGEAIAERLRIPADRVITLPGFRGTPGATHVRSADVMQAMDAAFGIGGWSMTVDDVRVVEQPQANQNGRFTRATVATTVTVRALGVSFQACAAAGSVGSREFASRDEALNTAIMQASNMAFKRAAGMLGARAAPLPVSS